jgi:hypothetical protein
MVQCKFLTVGAGGDFLRLFVLTALVTLGSLKANIGSSSEPMPPDKGSPSGSSKSGFEERGSDTMRSDPPLFLECSSGFFSSSAPIS